MIERDERLQAALHASQVHGEVGVAVPEEAAMPESETAPHATSSRKGRAGHWAAWTAALVVTGGLLGAVVVGLLKFVNGPVQAKADATLIQAQASSSPTPATNQLASLYIDLTYPGVFDLVDRLNNDKQALEQFTITSKAEYRRTIAIDIRPLDSGDLNDDSSYRFRQLRPSDYTPAPDKIGGEAAVVMVKHDKTEQSLFWVHKGKEVIISITSTVPQDSVANFMTAVKTGLRWRE